MSETEADVRDEWGVIGPEGRMWAYQSAAVARTVAREQHKDLHHRTVTRGPWVRVAPLLLWTFITVTVFAVLASPVLAGFVAMSDGVLCATWAASVARSPR